MRIGSQVISAIMGGITVFYLYYASQAPYPDLARWLLIDALKWGGLATVVVQCQARYLDR
jgi:hypothetical protein